MESGPQEQAAQEKAAPGQQIVRIRCRLDGPLVVEMPSATPGEGSPGDPTGAGVRLVVTDHLGGAFPLPTHKRAVALCRCGQTRSRPFCDGSHKTCDFRAADLAGPADSAPTD